MKKKKINGINKNATMIYEERENERELKQKNIDIKEKAIITYLTQEMICPICSGTEIELSRVKRDFWKTLGDGIMYRYTCKNCSMYAETEYKPCDLEDVYKTNYETMLSKMDLKQPVFY